MLKVENNIKYLANCWNSEYDGLSHVNDPSALANAACLFPLPDNSVYFLIISWMLKRTMSSNEE